jgi:predicted DNA-binding transcriptional regulator AlpA
MNIVSTDTGATISTGLKQSSKNGASLPAWIDLDKPGRLRAKNLMAILNVSRTTFYSGVRTGRYPKPDGLDGKMPYWLTSTVRPLV